MLQPVALSDMKKKAVLINNEKESRTDKGLHGSAAWSGEKRRLTRSPGITYGSRKREGEIKGQQSSRSLNTHGISEEPISL